MKKLLLIILFLILSIAVFSNPNAVTDPETLIAQHNFNNGANCINESDTKKDNSKWDSVKNKSNLIKDIDPLRSYAYVIPPISCTGSDAAIIHIEAVGGVKPYRYQLLDEKNNQLSPVQNSKLFYVLSAGTYITIVRDSEDEQFFTSVTIEEPLDIEVMVDVRDVTVNGANDGNIVILVAGEGAPYQYSLNRGNLTHNNMFSDLAPGAYVITVVASNGCEEIKYVMLNEPEILSINTNLLGSGVYVYPNPVKTGDVSVILKNDSIGDIQLFLYASDGRKVISKTAVIVNNVIKINMDGLTSGIYSLKIKTSAETYTRRIIKN